MCYAGQPHRYDASFEITDERMDVRASDAERDAVVESPCPPVIPGNEFRLMVFGASSFAFRLSGT